MRDEELRARTRDHARIDAPTTAAKVLLDRDRMGDLAPERLQLAAFCGHPLARDVVPVRDRRGRLRSPRCRHDSRMPDAPCPRETCVRRWALGLARFGSMACIRAAYHGAMSTLRYLGLEGEDCREERNLWAIRLWLSTPADARARAYGLDRRGDRRDHNLPEDKSNWDEKVSTLLTLKRPEDGDDEQLRDGFDRADCWSLMTWVALEGAANACVDEAELPPSEGLGWPSIVWLPAQRPHLERVVRAAASGVASWALGEPDRGQRLDRAPVVERRIESLLRRARRRLPRALRAT